MTYPEPSSRTDYEYGFDSRNYLRQYYSYDSLTSDDRETCRFFQDYFSRNPRPQRRMLDVGCGPTLHYSFSISQNFDQIDYADLLPQNLAAIHDWKTQQPEAHDWSGYFLEIVREEIDHFDHPVDLDSRAEERIAKFRQAINSFYLCNLLETNTDGDLELRPYRPDSNLDTAGDQPVQPTNAKYDLVTTFYCPECVATSVAQWSAIVQRLTSLLVPGGQLAMAIMKNCKEYHVLDRTFPALALDELNVEQELQKMSFGHLEINVVDSPAWKDDGFEQIILVAATICKNSVCL